MSSCIESGSRRRWDKRKAAGAGALGGRQRKGAAAEPSVRAAAPWQGVDSLLERTRFFVLRRDDKRAFVVHIAPFVADLDGGEPVGEVADFRDAEGKTERRTPVFVDQAPLAALPHGGDALMKPGCGL